MDAAAPVTGFRHPVRIAAVAVLALALSWAEALQRPVPAWERRLTTWFNGAPDWVAGVLYPVMQAGTLLAPVVAAVLVAVFRRDLFLAAATLVAGIAAWFVAKLVKDIVGRERPLTYIPGIDVREGTGAGLGYLSGHAAVAAATAVCVLAAVAPRWRPLVAALAVLVGVARMVYGVHFPADVVGGWAIGTLVALGALWLAGTTAQRWTGARSSASDSVAHPVRASPD